MWKLRKETKLKPLAVMSTSEVRNRLKSQLKDKLNPQAYIVLADRGYTPITEEQVSKFYKESDLSLMTYRSEVFDCDDYSASFKAYIGEVAGKDMNLTHPYAFGTVFGDLTTPHAINWFITPKGFLKFIEPQNGKITDPFGSNVIFLYS